MNSECRSRNVPAIPEQHPEARAFEEWWEKQELGDASEYTKLGIKFSSWNGWLARSRTTVSETQPRKGWAIRHVDGRWRTMDSIGMPDFTDDPAKALVCRLREHVDSYAADDPEDVRIVEVEW